MLFGVTWRVAYDVTHSVTISVRVDGWSLMLMSERQLSIILTNRHLVFVSSLCYICSTSGSNSSASSGNHHTHNPHLHSDRDNNSNDREHGSGSDSRSNNSSTSGKSNATKRIEELEQDNERTRAK